VAARNRDRALTRHANASSLDEPFEGVDRSRYDLAVGPSDFDCAGCGEDTHDELYMVTDELWRSLRLPKPGVLLSMGCLENLLDRILTLSAFTGCFLNAERSNHRSSRLSAVSTASSPHRYGTTSDERSPATTTSARVAVDCPLDPAKPGEAGSVV
jgi:hypothetical protein